MVRAGDKWAVWRDYNAGCTCDTSSWSQEFPSDCAKCICDNIRHLYNYCHKFESIYSGLTAVTIVLFAFGILCVAIALTRLDRQALVANKRTISKRFSKKISVYQV
eukprot:Phypoly_transcript_23952.p1 GENE.Phypoly_transcript_23952~~Phypoly_transcript_23952.p1  ORF type:complete len:106 (+),score=2.93 Phypoly_transcript_23952:216-533(+)